MAVSGRRVLQPVLVSALILCAMLTLLPVQCAGFCSPLPDSNAHNADLLLQPWQGCPLDHCHPRADVQHVWCLIKHQFTGFLCTRPVVWVAKWARQRAAFLPEGHPLHGSQPSLLL